MNPVPIIIVASVVVVLLLCFFLRFLLILWFIRGWRDKTVNASTPPSPPVNASTPPSPPVNASTPPPETNDNFYNFPGPASSCGTINTPASTFKKALDDCFNSDGSCRGVAYVSDVEAYGLSDFYKIAGGDRYAKCLSNYTATHLSSKRPLQRTRFGCHTTYNYEQAKITGTRFARRILDIDPSSSKQSLNDATSVSNQNSLFNGNIGICLTLNWPMPLPSDITPLLDNLRTFIVSQGSKMSLISICNEPATHVDPKDMNNGKAIAAFKAAADVIATVRSADPKMSHLLIGSPAISGSDDPGSGFAKVWLKWADGYKNIDVIDYHPHVYNLDAMKV